MIDAATTPADSSGAVLSVIAILVSIMSGLWVILGSNGRKKQPAEPLEAIATSGGGRAAMWARIDELSETVTQARIEAAEKFSTRADIESLTSLVRDVDARSRRVEVILQTVFHDTLARKGIGGTDGT